MPDKINIMIVQTRHIESISYLTAELVNTFPKEKYHVTLVYLETGVASENDKLADRCVFLNLSKTDYKGLRLAAMNKLKPFLQANHFDVIIANMYKPMQLLMQLRASFSASLCIGIIHTFGEFDRMGRRWMMRFFLDKRWQLVGVSEAVRDYLINARCGLHAGNTHAINNAVDIEALTTRALSADSARTRLGLPAQGLVFGTVGRCVKGKRHVELIEAFHRFASARDHVYLIIIGDGPMRPELESLVNRYQLQGRVFLPGVINDAFACMRALDVFVFPSAAEGFGLALVEAMALSLPTIVNDVEPLTTIVGEWGIKADTGNTDALAAAMDYLARLTTNERQALGLQHYQRVSECYSIDVYRAAYLALVENHLAGAES